MPAPSAKSHRLLRVGELLRHTLAEILTRGDIRDPAINAVSLTVTEVRVSPDLRNATVYVMPLGGVHETEVLAGLTRSAGYLRGQVSRAVTLRYVPKFIFEIDQTFDEADRIDALLRNPKVAQDLGHDQPGAGPSGDEDEG